MGQLRSKVSLKYEERDFWRDFLGQYYALLKSTSVKKGCAKSKKTPKFGVGAILRNCKKVHGA